MGSYLLVETRDPFDSADTARFYDLAESLAAEANDVTLFLVQNGVLPTRRDSVAGGRITEMAGRMHVLADELSLRERGIQATEMPDEVRAAPIDTLVDLAAEPGRKVIWH